MSSIESFLPYWNESIGMFQLVAAHHPHPDVATVLHRFFERLLNNATRLEDQRSWAASTFIVTQSGALARTSRERIDPRTRSLVCVACSHIRVPGGRPL